MSVAFFRMPKTAGLTVARCLPAWVDVGHHATPPAIVREWFKRYEKSFVFVRHPYSRFISAFCWLGSWRHREPDLERLDYFTYEAMARYLPPGIAADNDTSFMKAFASNLREFVYEHQDIVNHHDRQGEEGVCGRTYDPKHFLPQSEYLREPEGDLIVTRVGKYESLVSDLVDIAGEFDIELEVVPEFHGYGTRMDRKTPNHAAAFKLPFWEVLDEEMCGLLYDFYREDFDRFGYSYDLAVAGRTSGEGS